jgi:hypothetical protein
VAPTRSHKTFRSRVPLVTVIAMSLVVGVLMTMLFLRGGGGESVAPPAVMSPSISATPPTPSPSSTSKSVTLGEVKDVVAQADPLTISVLGDSTGNDTTDWVVLWARHLAKDRKVAVHQWDATKQQYVEEPLRYGTGRRAATIWNASQSGAKANFAADMIATVQPKHPDLVIYNFGHNNTSSDIGQQLSEDQNAVASHRGQIPAVVMLQNPGLHEHGSVQKETLVAVSRWANANGLPTVPVASAFEVDTQRLMLDDTHPNERGMKVWASVVAATIG